MQGQVLEFISSIIITEVLVDVHPYHENNNGDYVIMGQAYETADPMKISSSIKQILVKSAVFKTA